MLLKLNSIFITTILVGSMGLISSAKPSLSHAGKHNNSNSQTKQLQKPSEEETKTNHDDDDRQKMETPISNPTNKPLVSPTSEDLQKSPSTSTSFLKRSNLIPQPTELVFFLLLASPFLLYTIKKKVYQKESN